MEHDIRLKRVRFRAWHRGMKEMDLIFGRFVDTYFDTLTPEDLDALEALMDHPDQQLSTWFMGREPVPDTVRSPLYDRISTFTYLRQE